MSINFMLADDYFIKLSNLIDAIIQLYCNSMCLITEEIHIRERNVDILNANKSTVKYGAHVMDIGYVPIRLLIYSSMYFIKI